MSMLRKVLGAQGVYFLITGVWPIVSITTFEAVTGPKTDDWLVQTVGGLAAAVGLSLFYGLRHRTVSAYIVFVAIATAAAFFLVDVIFSLRGIISKIYLIDAAVQAVLILLVATSAKWESKGSK
jgi:energy-converting hydrogenase Eha subunit E